MTVEFGATGRSELVLVSAADDEALVAEISRLAAFLDRIPDAPLADVAYTCSLTRGDAVLGANFDAIDPVGTAAKGGRAAAIVLEEEPEDRL